VIRPALRDIEVYLCVEPVDFRKQVNGLSMLVESELALDPLSSAVFAFTNRRRKQVLVRTLFHRRFLGLFDGAGARISRTGSPVSDCEAVTDSAAVCPGC
jgi:hypothetical protein